MCASMQLSSNLSLMLRVAVGNRGCISLADVRAVHDPGGGGCWVLFCQGLPWLIPVMPREASHAFTHAGERGRLLRWSRLPPGRMPSSAGGLHAC